MAAIQPSDSQVPIPQPPKSDQGPPKQVDQKVSSRVLRLLGLFQGAIPRVIYGAGKDKLIVQHEDPTKAYMIPQASFFGTRRRNIENELKTMQGIRNGLAKENIDPKESNLALGVERSTSKKGAWETGKAEGNLEKKVSQELDISTRFSYCRGVLNGMSKLHNAGYIHGDVKLENVLFYKDDHVEVSDFGKSDNKDGIYSGNTRYGPPEGTRSQKGDVYGAGICLIRILEEHVLHNETRLPTAYDNLGTKVPPADKERRGVEEFILECPAFTRSYEQKGTFKGKVLDFKARLETITNRQTPSRNNPETKALEGYINTLCQRLETAGVASKIQSKELNALLRLMTYPDPDKRITMEAALTNFNKIFPK